VQCLPAECPFVTAHTCADGDRSFRGGADYCSAPIKRGQLDFLFFAPRALSWATFALFYLRRFEVALSWAMKSLAHQTNFDLTMWAAQHSYAMLGRVEDAQMMLARRCEARVVRTISQTRISLSHMPQEDLHLVIEAARISGVPE
jgi:hypothetical protein